MLKCKVTRNTVISSVTNKFVNYSNSTASPEPANHSTAPRRFSQLDRRIGKAVCIAQRKSRRILTCRRRRTTPPQPATATDPAPQCCVPQRSSSGPCPPRHGSCARNPRRQKQHDAPREDGSQQRRPRRRHPLTPQRRRRRRSRPQHQHRRRPRPRRRRGRPSPSTSRARRATTWPCTSGASGAATGS